MRLLYLIFARHEGNILLRDEKGKYIHFNDLERLSEHVIESYSQDEVEVNCNDLNAEDRTILQSKLESRMDKELFKIYYNLR